MGNPQAEGALDEVRGLEREQAVHLLDRAAEIGLLIPHGGGYYGVHPALPWYFRGLFARYFAGEKAQGARRAFVEAIGELANYYHQRYNEGNRQVLQALMAEEDNLLAAWRLARQNGWWRRVTSAMQGLRTLYAETGRGPAWRRLVETVTPEFVDPNTDLPLPGREDDWNLVTDYRVGLALAERVLDKAERLQRLNSIGNASVPVRRWLRCRSSAAPASATTSVRSPRLCMNSDKYSGTTTIPSCADSYGEAFSLAQSIADRVGQATCAFNLGVAYTNVARLRDYDVAEQWLRQSLDLTPPGDTSGRGKTVGQLGKVSLLRYDDSEEKGRPPEERLRFLIVAKQHYQQALQLCPPTAIVQRGGMHNQLGLIFERAGDIDRALEHYQQAIRYREQAGDIFGAGQTRDNVRDRSVSSRAIR